MSGPLVIAEAGVNHNGDVDRAIELVRAAKTAGANVVKFQYFTAGKIAAADAQTAGYQQSNTGKRNQADLLRSLELPIESFAKIARVCHDEGISFLCTVFDIEQVDDFVALGMRLVKIPSGELTNAPLLARYGKLELPVLLSTGMGTMAEVKEAVAVLEKAGVNDITLLQCTSLYPAPPETLNLRAMVSMANQLKRPVGFSDHSLGDYAAIAAVALGASVIEKHFTLDRTLPGPDHASSLEPEEFAHMVVRLRQTAAALGDGIKRPASGEAETAQLVRRSWHAARDIASGTVLSAQDVVLKRPAAGLQPAADPVGRRARRLLAADSPITADALD